jgi:hypothetical protein
MSGGNFPLELLVMVTLLLVLKCLSIDAIGEEATAYAVIINTLKVNEREQKNN